MTTPATRTVAPARVRLHRRDPGVHVAHDFGRPESFTHASVELVCALVRQGVRVSVPPARRLAEGIGPDKAAILRGCMRGEPLTSAQVKWSDADPAFLKRPLAGDVNVEFFSTNHVHRAGGGRPCLWMRSLRCDLYRKLPLSRFDAGCLRDLGVADSEMAVVPIGYSPEVDRLFPAGAETPAGPADDFHVLLATDGRDPLRCGTDLAVRAIALAWGPDDRVVVHIRDDGPAAGRNPVRDWIAAEKRFPRVEWHRDRTPAAGWLQRCAAADVVLAPFRGERLPAGLLDAMAVGTPLLMPAHGSPAEYAPEGGFIALPFDLVPAGQGREADEFYLGEGAVMAACRVGELAETLRTLPGRRDELRALGRRCRDHVRGRYSWDAAAAKFMAALGAWGRERDAVVSGRLTPDEVPLSVIIPTKDRAPILRKCLEAYSRQELPASDYELVLVNDHGEEAPVRALAEEYRGRVPLRLIDNPGARGQGPARNHAFPLARGEIVVIAGDDIIPAPGFLSGHLATHRRHPELETAVVGFTPWHGELEKTPFMDYITGAGGEQFRYDGMKHDEPVCFDRFYTSNCSLKRAFLAELEHHFSHHFHTYGYEDVEFAYRLHLRGMVLRYCETAVGHHLHPMSPGTFRNRQRNAGRMLTVLSLVQPSYVPDEHTDFLRALEFMAAWPGRDRIPWDRIAQDGARHLDSLTRLCEALFAMEGKLARPVDRPVTEQDRAHWDRWTRDGAVSVWKTISTLSFRLGMAEEWAQDDALRRMAAGWVYHITLPRALGQAPGWHLPPLPAAQAGSLFPRSRLAYGLARFAREAPVLGRCVAAFEHSPAGRHSRKLLARLVRGPE